MASAWTRLRQRVGWSNSRQAWEERIGVGLLLVGAVTVWSLGSRLSLLQVALAWGVLLVSAAVLLRRGWLKLFGPVLFYDMIRAARRGRYFLLRCVYAGILLFFLFASFADSWRHHIVGHREAARLAEQFFETLMLIQLVAVTILTPAYVAGSIAEEKDRKTMEFLLATDLRNREIVLSKLVSRLANLTLFLLTGLPILSLIQFLGGVDPNLVLAGFVATVMTMLGLGGVSILNSVAFKRPRDAIAMTYLMVVAYIVLSLMLLWARRLGLALLATPIWFGDNPPTLDVIVTALISGNLIVSIGEFTRSLVMGRNAVDAVWTIVRSYAIFHGVLAVGCTVWATLRLRAVALKQAFGKTRKVSRAGRQRPAVGEQPMLWKELYVEGGLRFNLLASIILAVLIIATFIPAFIIIVEHTVQRSAWRGELARDLNIWVRVVGSLAGMLMLLAVAVRASSSIGAERDKQTYDALLTSPLDSTAILSAKWLGSILSIRLAWVWLGSVWVLGVLTGGLHIVALPLLVVAWLVYAAGYAMLGLWFSMTCSTTTRATLWTMTWAVVLAGGHMLVWACCIPLMFMGGGRGPEVLAQFQSGLIPWIGLGVLAFIPEELRYGNEEFRRWLLFCIVGVVLWALAAVIFWFGVLSQRYRVLTGRQDLRYPDASGPPGGWRGRQRWLPPPLPYADDDTYTTAPERRIRRRRDDED